ncbi:hypothetical protein CQ12_10765 [Bradyrhizobium jicamae]|uniref:Transcriptional regulator n=1 Tax=Bradyrhizobium jicamae TaxID=280332 RepID=A0A0R3M3R8_9BRAD|nr:AlpA family phage regulatory protein [Bradyrhizobium jicamae]KRR14604.1 hypothetical protein CQ12_10765 [Bradyrhizobium jicamae]
MRKDQQATAVDYAAGGIRRMLTEEQVLAIIPVSGVTLWRMVRDGRFPRPHYISPNRKVWFSDEIVAWQNDVERQRQRRPARAKS